MDRTQAGRESRLAAFPLRRRFEGSAGRIERLGDPAGNRDAMSIRSELSSLIGPYRFTILPTRMSS
jgi:hypothetical protein